jgi:ankyrin repeat protein
MSEWRERFPLHFAACCVDASTLHTLLEQPQFRSNKRALDAIDDEGRAALHYAAWNGLGEPTELLLKAGADPDVLSGDRRSTPLHLAAGMGRLQCVQVLLRYGADSSCVDIDKWTALDLARQDLMGSPERPAIEALLESVRAAKG